MSTEAGGRFQPTDWSQPMLRSAKEVLALIENQRRRGVFTDAEAQLLHKHIVAGSFATIIRNELNPSISRLAEKLSQIMTESWE